MTTIRHRSIGHCAFFILLLAVSTLGLSATASEAACPPFYWTATCDGGGDCLLYLDVLEKCGTSYHPALQRCDVFIAGCNGIGGIVYGYNIVSQTDCTLLGVTIFSCPGSGGGGGCPDPPSQHGPIERLALGADTDADMDADPAARNMQTPPIIGIAGRGVFAEHRLVLLYDNGFAQGTSHRLSFATMVAHGESAAPVYTAGDLLGFFQEAYDGATIAVAAPQRKLEGRGADDRALERSSEIIGADGALRDQLAVIELPNGWKIGLINELHRESWYVSQEEYSRRYTHDRGQFIHSSGLSAMSTPVTLNLTTVYVEDGKQWVSDPLLVLEALEEFFVPTAKQHDQLLAALHGFSSPLQDPR